MEAVVALERLVVAVVETVVAVWADVVEGFREGLGLVDFGLGVEGGLVVGVGVLEVGDWSLWDIVAVLRL